MPECSYCGENFDDEQSYLEHLRDDHEGELGTIDQRRVDEELDSSDDGGVPTGPLVLGIVLAVSLVLVGYVIFVHGSGGGGDANTVNGIEVAQTPGTAGAVHEHGLINVTVDGEQIDFSRAEYQNPREYDAFHFEGGDGRIWHKHAEGVTLEYALATLDIGVTENSVTIDGTTYDGAEPDTTVNVTVNGEPVVPASYELQGTSEESAEEGDFIRIVVTTDE